MDFAVPAGHRVKTKESEKIDKYLDLAREMVTMKPIVISELGIVPKGLKRRPEKLKIRGQIANIETTALLRLIRILRRVQEM